jgi:hypothetical protein
MLGPLRQLLRPLPAGSILEGREAILQELADIWSRLPGTRQEKTTPGKLFRAEELSWNPPYLSFVLARHGGTAMGSSREALHTRTVNADTGESTLNTARHRQVRSMDNRVTSKDMEAIARELLALIEQGAKDPRLTWNRNGAVTIVLRAIIEANNNMTRRSRTRRFRAIMEPLMAAAG